MHPIKLALRTALTLVGGRDVIVKGVFALCERQKKNLFFEKKSFLALTRLLTISHHLSLNADG